MDNSETTTEVDLPAQVELEVDPFESIIDSVNEGEIPIVYSPNNVGKETQEGEDTTEKLDIVTENVKQEVESENVVKEEFVVEKLKKKRGRPKKSKIVNDDDYSSSDEVLSKSRSEISAGKSENSQDDENLSSRRSHRSKRPSSFITKYDTGSGSEDEKLFRNVNLSDDEYTPEKEAGKNKRKKVNGSGVKNLSDDFNAENSQDYLENIKIESVSTVKKCTNFNEQQIDASTQFLTQVMRSTSNLGTFVKSKADEFIDVRLTPGFLSDTEKFQFCIEKSFKLLELIKNNLKAIDTEMRQNYIDFVRQNKFEKDISHDKSTVKFLTDHKISFEKNGTQSCPDLGADSDSDCEIVGEIPSTPKKSLDILKRVERNGIVWKTHKGSISSQCSDGSTKIQIPGRSAIFLNKNIKVKKVAQKPQFESFFWEDGRTLKPPDKVLNFKTRYKIKSLEKTTLILGWLDLAYRKASKQFYQIVREFERKKHYESCSDLGESCDDYDSDPPTDTENCNAGFSPKTLSQLCLDKINKHHKSTTPSITFEMLEKEYSKIMMTLKRYFPFPDDILLDICQIIKPDSLMNLCTNRINEVLQNNYNTRLNSCNKNMMNDPISLNKLCTNRINDYLKVNQHSVNNSQLKSKTMINVEVKDNNLDVCKSRKPDSLIKLCTNRVNYIYEAIDSKILTSSFIDNVVVKTNVNDTLKKLDKPDKEKIGSVTNLISAQKECIIVNDSIKDKSIEQHPIVQNTEDMTNCSPMTCEGSMLDLNTTQKNSLNEGGVSEIQNEGTIVMEPELGNSQLDSSADDNGFSDTGEQIEEDIAPVLDEVIETNNSDSVNQNTVAAELVSEGDTSQLNLLNTGDIVIENACTLSSKDIKLFNLLNEEPPEPQSNQLDLPIDESTTVVKTEINEEANVASDSSNNNNNMFEPEINIKEEDDFSDNFVSEDNDGVNEVDNLLQVTHEIFLQDDKFTKKSKKALRNLLESSSSDDGLMNPAKKRKVIRRKKLKKQALEKVVDKIVDPRLNDPKLTQKVCKVILIKIPIPISYQSADITTESVLPESFSEIVESIKKTINQTVVKQGKKIPTVNSVADEIVKKTTTESPKVSEKIATKIPPSNVPTVVSQFEEDKEDSEIDRLLDFTTLGPRVKTKVNYGEDDNDCDSEERVKKDKKHHKKRSHKDRSDLMNLLTSGKLGSSSNSGSSDDTEDEEGTASDVMASTDFNFDITNEKNVSFLKKIGLEVGKKTSEDTIESLVKQHKEINKITAKNLLMLSSSEDSDSNDDNNIQTCEKNVVRIKKKPENKAAVSAKNVASSENEKTKEKSKINNVLKSFLDTISSSEDEVTVVENEEIQQDTNHLTVHANNHSEMPLAEGVINDSIKLNKDIGIKNKEKHEKKKRKKKPKIVTESDEERKMFQKKRRRMVRREERQDKQRMVDDSSDNGSVDTLSSQGSDVSEEEMGNTYQPSSQRDNANTEYFVPIIKREPGLERTPKKRPHAQVSSQSDADDNDDAQQRGRKKIREVIEDDSLLMTTKMAAKEEEERLIRLVQKNNQMGKLFMSPNKESCKTEFVLDADIVSKAPLLSVHPKLVTIMKEHQIDGVKFMWDTCFESVKMVKDGVPGGGCILAHCMGLGKSLQVITLIHTILSSDMPLRTVLICCPLSTVLNWADEFKKWLRKIDCSKAIKIYELSKYKKHYERSFHLEDWQKTGGVFIMGYEMFRLLTTLKERPDCKAHVIKRINSTLLNPGPDIVVCDEGHLLKNDNTTLAKLMNKIRSRRRIVLTGTPLQNNLKEYYCMVNFVKPSLLGSRKEYFNRFENPILNGQHRDSSTQDIQIMKKRSHVLHKMLEGCVQRKEATLLYKYLPRKREYVLLTTLSDCQAKIYRHYLSKYTKGITSKASCLLKDFHTLQKIWTHPRTLQKFYHKSREVKLRTKPKEKVGFTVSQDGVICIEDADDVAEESLATDSDVDWWMDYVTQNELENLECSPKFTIAFQLLEEALQIGDKVLIFSTSLFTLDSMEFFLKKNKKWTLGKHYYRLDGSVTLENRQKWCRNFNSERNKDVKLFLISTRAGGLGINMIAANRVIIMDVSWNPSHDIQSIFRVYRFGQRKDCYIYRLVSMGTMEEKIYERSVTKQAISLRVVDEQQIDRHYNTTELTELYTFNPVPVGSRPVPNIPSDDVLASILSSSISTSGRAVGGQSNGVPLVWSLHEHDSLLRDLRDEQLDEEERVAAWLEYQDEREQQKRNKQKMLLNNAAMNNRLPISGNELVPFGMPRSAYTAMINNLMALEPLPENNNLLMPVSMRPVRPHNKRYRPTILRRLPHPSYNPPPPLHQMLGSYSSPRFPSPLPPNVPGPSFPSLPPNITIQPSVYSSSTRQLPLSYQDSFANSFGNVTITPRPASPSMLSNWVVPMRESDLYNNPATVTAPVRSKKATASTSKAITKIKSPKNKQTKKQMRNKHLMITQRSDSPIIEPNNMVFLPMPIGSGSCESESIVPDKNDSPIVTIELD